jgi:hypothetical protein
MTQHWFDRDRGFAISHLAAAFASGALLAFSILVYAFPSAPSRPEMQSLVVEPEYRDWSGSSLESYWRFGPYRCQDDCSGHDAGWRWAQARMISSKEQCEGAGSISFYEGCSYFVQVRGRAPAYYD